MSFFEFKATDFYKTGTVLHIPINIQKTLPCNCINYQNIFVALYLFYNCSFLVNGIQQNLKPEK